MNRLLHGISLHADDRGELIAVELEQAPFVVKRVFVVRAPDQQVQRGGHVVLCHELLILMSGEVTAHISRHAAEDVVLSERLTEPGQSVQLFPGDFIEYFLDNPLSSVLVLADQPFEAR